MIAFGGNALLRAGQKGTFDEQLENVERTCQQLVPLIEKGYDIVIGHGNGPQVGNALLRHEAGSKAFGMPAMPMDFCGAETQGSSVPGGPPRPGLEKGRSFPQTDRRA